MRDIFKALIAGWGANKISKNNGCGCIGTIILFIILFGILGYFFG